MVGGPGEATQRIYIPMIDSTRGARYAAILSIVALAALLLTPFLFQRHIEGLRSIITTSLEPGREASADVRLALAREVGAIRGFLLTRDRSLLVEYVTSRRTEEAALQRLAAVEGLETTLVAKARQLEAASHHWSILNDRLADGSLVPDATFLARLPDQQIRYRAALDASEVLDRSLTRAIADVRSRTGAAERRWALASMALALLAATAATLVVLMLRATLRETTLARTDALTALYNRRGFAELARRELSRAQRNGSSITLLTFDLDGFKLINDRQGHAAGDRLLLSVAQAIREAIREIDVGARLGGDEFAILLPDNRASPPDRAVERVRDVIVDRLRRDDWLVTLSVGAVTLRDARVDIDELIQQADALMYRVKNAGKDSIHHEVLSPSTTSSR